MSDCRRSTSPGDPDGRHERRRWRLALAASCVLVVSIVVLNASRTSTDSSHRSRPDITAPEPEDELDPSDPMNPGYSGMPSCESCHAARVKEFARTAHARACRRPDPREMPKGFEPAQSTFLSSDRTLRFTMRFDGQNYWQRIDRTTGPSPPATTQINLVYGANRADEVFFNWESSRISELMSVWLHPLDRWAHGSYDHHGTGSLTRETTPRCLECHTTWLSHVPGTMNEYRPDGALLGVTCEKCHGPGQRHIAHHRLHPEENRAHEIINPSRLSRDRGIEVCTQCHGNFVKPRGPAFSYRPGEPLDAYFRLAETQEPEEDHVANQIRYLKQSRCFQGSGKMTCVTCHNPHRPHDVVDRDSSRRSCLVCHQSESCLDRPNLPAAVRDDCVNCHMPHRVWMNVHFHTEDDRYVPPIQRVQHRIAVDRIARSEVLLAWHRRSGLPGSRAEADQLRDDLVRHWLGEFEKRRSAYRGIAAIGAAREALRLEPTGGLRTQAEAALRTAIEQQSRLDRLLVDAMHFAQENRTEEAIGLYERVLDLKPNQARAHSKLGTLLAAAGRTDQAREHLEAVAKCNPDDGSGHAMLGWLDYLARRTDEATARYRRAVAIEPYDANLHYHWGLTLLQARDGAGAAEQFQRAIQIDPRHAGAWQGLSHARRETGATAASLRAARRAARLTDFAHLDILVTLADAYSAAGREAEAASAADRALNATPSSLTPETRRRMISLDLYQRP